MIVSNEEWPALPPRNPHEDQVIKVALSTKPKKNKYRSKKKSKGSTKSSLAIKTCDLVQQTMHHKDKAFGSSDAFSAVSPDKAVDLHYIASNDEICQQVQASSGVIPEHLSQNRIPIKGTKLKTVESGNMMANLGNHSVTELIRSSDKSTEYSPDSVNHCRQSIPSCPKKASERNYDIFLLYILDNVCCY